ncbi:MAG: YfhO family protein, partial [Acidimicrobiia bacterium]
VRLWIVSERAGQGGSLARQAVIPLLAGALTAAAVWGSARFRPGRHAVVLWILPLLFGLEAVAFARSYWPVSERDEFYPVTAAHRQLAQRIGRERLAGAGGALFPGSTTFYGLRSLTTNNTLPQMPEWEELIRAADPTAFEQSPVFPSLAPGAEVATSPILDRLSVRYFVVPPNLAVFGRREQAAPVQDLFLDPLTIDAEASGGPVRAVLLRLVRPWAGPAGRVVAIVRHGSGGPVSRGSREIFPGLPEGWFQVPVAEPLCPAGGCGPGLSVSVGLPPGDPGAFGPERKAISVVVGEQDGLRVDIVSNVVGYRNLDALPGIRWASGAVVEEDGDQRIRLLSGGVSADRVLLSDRGPAGSGEEADLEVLEDSGDVIRVRVHAAGDGYLVIADPLQHGWLAELDGHSVPLRAADHALVAVHVPQGSHLVEIRYGPPGWDLGLGVSAATALGLAAAFLLPLRRRRSSVV